MKKSKEMYREMQQQGYDIDNSGHMFEEPKPTLAIEHTNHGKFYKASLNGVAITEEKTMEILGIEDLKGRRLEYYARQFQDKTQQYIVDIWEQNVD